MSLTYTEAEDTKNNPQQLVVFLHGYGSNADDLIDLAEEFRDVLPNAHFISPNAPFEFEGGLPGAYQWFSLYDVTMEEIEEQVVRANDVLNGFLNEQLKRFNLSDENLILIGFSQGAMMSMYHSLRRDNEVMGVVSYSGKLLGIEELDDEIKSTPRMCLIHGTEDQVVPFVSMAEAESVLSKYEVPVEAYPIFGLEHGINAEGIEIAREFLIKVQEE